MAAGACANCGMIHGDGVCARPLPRRIDRYELLTVLGGGTFGAVYRARHAVTGEYVAVKVLRRKAAEQPEETQRLITEARAMSQVRDLHVVRVLDAGVSESGEAFVAMELEAGVSLQALLELEQGRPLPPARAIAIVIQILEGLSAVHAQGIVHRDLKPSNVLISNREGRDFARLLDFGVSKVPGAQMMTLPGSSMGTPGFMAPELFGNAAHADGRADLYGVAATLFYLLTLRLPFEATSYEDLVVKVRTERATSLAVFAPHLSPNLVAVVDRGLARDRDARFSDAVSFAAALASVAAFGLTPPFQPTFPANFPPNVAPIISAPPSPYAQPSMSTHPGVAYRLMPDPGSIGGLAPNTRPTTSPSGSWLPWVLGMLMGALVLGIGVVGAFLMMRAKSGDEPTGPSAVTTSTPTSTSTSTPTPTSTSTSTSTPTSTPTSTSTPKAGKSRIAFGPPQFVGEIGLGQTQSLTARALPEARLCPIAKHQVVMVDLFVQASGDISMAHPSTTNTGDPAIASCIGAAFQDAARAGWKPSSGGIVTITATVDPP